MQIKKAPSRELLHSRPGPHISHGPWLPKRASKPSDIESQPSFKEAAMLEEKGRKKNKEGKKKNQTKRKLALP